jgi:glycosyltransferase involved in cell wall biosynthesis
MTDGANSRLPSPIRLVICWTEINGYMAACWRELTRRPGIELFVIVGRTTAESHAPFEADVMRGVPCRILSAEERGEPNLIASLVIERKPHVVLLCGWATPAYVALASNRALMDCRFILALDTPWKNSLRQRVGKYWMRSFLHRMDGALVAGERAAKLAHHLDLPERFIQRGMYGIDFDAFSVAAASRPPEWPRRFLYVGRYAPEKGILTLLGAYRNYRKITPDPWPLACCGTGPLADLLPSVEGIEDIGFVQPANLPAVMASHGVLVLPSHYEPWGAALAEGCASGLPVIATDACGAALDVVRNLENGLVIPADNESALADALRWMSDHPERLAAMGQRSRELASAFSAQRWADRVLNLMQSVL